MTARPGSPPQRNVTWSLSAVVKITLRTTMTYLIVGCFTPLALRSHALTGRGWVDGLPVLDLGAAEDDSPVKRRYRGDWQGCAARPVAALGACGGEGG